jgi:hypothetical protein
MITGVEGYLLQEERTELVHGGHGTIRLDVVDDDTILDAVGNPLSGGFTSGESYTVEKNHAPTNLVMDNSTVAENQPVSTLVGTLTTTDPDAEDTFTYDLVAGTGDSDNASFTLVGDQLLAAVIFNYETKTVTRCGYGRPTLEDCPSSGNSPSRSQPSLPPFQVTPGWPGQP